MTLTLELSPEMEARLREKAARDGKDIADYLVALAEEDLLDYNELPWPNLSAQEDFDGTVAAIGEGLADVASGRTIRLEDYKAEVLARRQKRDEENQRVHSQEGIV